jgi:hypothetical protein
MKSTFLQCEQVVASVSDAFNISENELISLRDSMGEQILYLFKMSSESVTEQLFVLLENVEKESNKSDLSNSAIVQDIIEISKALADETKGYSWKDIDFNRYIPGGRTLAYSLHDIRYAAGMSKLDEIDMPDGDILWNGEKESVGDFVKNILVNMLLTAQAGLYFPSTAYSAEIEAWKKVFFVYINSHLNKITSINLKGV